ERSPVGRASGEAERIRGAGHGGAARAAAHAARAGAAGAVPQPVADGPPEIRISAVMMKPDAVLKGPSSGGPTASGCIVLVALLTAFAAYGDSRVSGQQPPQQPPSQPPSPRQPSEIELSISGDPGTPPRFAVPDFVSLTPDAADVGKTIGQVLWDDLNFEREFYMIP